MGHHSGIKTGNPRTKTWLCKFSQIIHGISLRQGGCEFFLDDDVELKKIEEPWAARAASQSHQSRQVIYTVVRKEPSRSIMYTYSILYALHYASLCSLSNETSWSLGIDFPNHMIVMICAYHPHVVAGCSGPSLKDLKENRCKVTSVWDICSFPVEGSFSC